MKSRTHKPSYLTLSLLFISLPFISGFYFNQLQDTTIGQDYVIQGSAFINLESIIGSSVAFQAYLEPSGYCELHQVSLSQTSQIPLNGTFYREDKAFHYNDIYYVFKIDIGTSQLSLTSFKQSDANNNKNNKLIASENLSFGEKERDLDNEIIDMKEYEGLKVISTKRNLFFLELSPSSNPILNGMYTVTQDATIKDFGFVANYRFFVSQTDSLLAFHYNLRSKKLSERITITSFTGNLPPIAPKLEPKETQTICVCEEFMYLGVRNYLLVVDGTQELEEKEELNVLKWRKMDSNIIQIKRAGRSLIVLTEQRLIEFLFIKDYLDLKLNIDINNQVFGFKNPIEVNERKEQIELKSSNNGTYFALVNKREGTVFIFQSAQHPINQASQRPYLYLHKGNNEIIKSIDLYESSVGYSSNTLKMIIQGKNQINVTQFLRNPLGIYCSKWTSGTATASITTKAQFCHNAVYNFTKFIEELEAKGRTIYNSEFYFDPSMPCTRTILIRLRFKWNSTYFLSIGGLLLGVILTLWLIRKLWKRKAEKKTKTMEPKITVKHKRFHNEKEKSVYDHSSHKIDVSHFNLPSTTDRNTGNSGKDYKSSKENETTTIPASKRKKNFTKKKNLEIKIPEN